MLWEPSAERFRLEFRVESLGFRLVRIPPTY